MRPDSASPNVPFSSASPVKGKTPEASAASLARASNGVKFDFKKDIEKEVDGACDTAFKKYESYLEEIRLNEALSSVWELISFADRYINENKPWELQKKRQATSDKATN